MKFLRRAAHYASILAPIALAVCGLSQPAEAQTKQADKKAAATGNREHTAEPISTITQVFNPPNATEPKADGYKEKIDQFLYNLETDPVVLVTVAIAFFAAWQVKVYREMRDHTMAVERAYIDISHNRPGFIDIEPRARGVILSSSTDPSLPKLIAIHANVKVKNAGNTPAVVTRHLLHECLWDEALPVEPPYDITKVKDIGVHLVKDESFNISGEFTVDLAKLNAAYNPLGNTKLYLLGFVDYIDKFGRCHRSGYARIYSALVDRMPPLRIERDRDGNITNATPNFTGFDKRSNLTYVTQAGYNYDIETHENGQPKKKRKG